jgi:hypothetical protein
MLSPLYICNVIVSLIKESRNVIVSFIKEDMISNENKSEEDTDVEISYLEYDVENKLLSDVPNCKGKVIPDIEIIIILCIASFYIVLGLVLMVFFNNNYVSN